MLSVCAMLGRASVAFAQAPDVFSGCATPISTTYQGGPILESDGKTWVIFINVRVVCDGTTVEADRIRFGEKTVVAEGNLLVTQDGLRINADRMEMDRATKLGVFFHAHGTARLSDQPAQKSMFGTMEPEVWFDAERIERMGPRTYKLTNGVFSTCVQPNARWEMRGSSGTVVLDDHATLRNVTFRVKGVPVLYIPYLYYPLKKDDRSTGILIPSYSSSGVRGNGISNAFFLALSRSMDATINHDYFTKTGQGAGGEYRYAATQGSGTAKLYVLFEKERLKPDGTVERAGGRSYDFRGTVNQGLGRHFSLGGRANYFSDVTTNGLYQQNVYQQSNANRLLSATLTGNGSGALRGLRLDALVERNEIFTGTASRENSGAPRLSLFFTRGYGKKLPVYLRSSGEFKRFAIRNDLNPAFSVRRFDGQATVSLSPSKLSYLPITTSATWHVARWLASDDPLTGLPAPIPITRSLLDLRATLEGPIIQRVFQTPGSGYSMRLKHIIDPRVDVSWLSPFDRTVDLIKLDNVDTLVGGSTSVNYSLTNTILARTRTPDGVGRIGQPLLNLVVSQSYYSQAQAGAVDPQYSIGSAGKLSPVQVRASLAPADTASVNFQMQINSASWPVPGRAAARLSYGASANLNRSRWLLSAGWSKVDYFTAAEGFVDLPSTNGVNASTTVHSIDSRVGATYGFTYDVANSRMIQQRAVFYYHAQCCGISVDYQTYNVSQFQIAGVPRDRRIAVTFTLAGIGSFAPPLGAFGR